MVKKTRSIPKLKSGKIKYHIDSIYKNKKDSILFIRGWAFSSTTVTVESKYSEYNASMQRNERMDVKEHYQLEDANVGFTIEYPLIDNLSTIELCFKAESGDCVNVRFNPNKKTNIITKTNFKDFYIYSKHHGIISAIKHAIKMVFNRPSIYNAPQVSLQDQYRLYNKVMPLSRSEIDFQRNEIKKFNYQPLISILVPVYNVPEKWLKKCIDSVLNQTYKNFELCLVDDKSPEPHIKKVLTDYAQRDKRIKVKFREENGHISETSNDALSLATGEFVALLDHDDELTQDALYEVVKVLNDNPKLDMIYSDEDKVTMDGEYIDPHFKPDWSPDTFMSCNYICHFTVLRKSIVDEIGGFRKGYEGAQDYDIFLRFVEKASSIYHIPKILYHWRMIETSTALNPNAKNYAYVAGRKALSDALERRGINGSVESYKHGGYRVKYHPTGKELVSIIIPTKDHADTLEICLKSIYEKTTYLNFEIIVISNNSTESKLFKLLNKFSDNHENFSWFKLDIPFNYSMINNEAVKKAKGDYILLLNNDVEVITPEWLELMVGYARQKHVGAVGAKLLYPDKTVQHCGIVIGMAEVGGHIYKGASSLDDGYVYRLSVPYNYGGVTGACLMVSKKKWQEVNGLEETLAVAFNDLDLNLKLLEEGYYNVVLPQVELFHYESKSRGSENTPDKLLRFSEDINYMKSKWKDELICDKCYNPNFDLSTEQVLLKL